MNEFKSYHPSVNFLYFTAIFAFSVVITDPFCIVAELTCFLVGSTILGGRKRLIANAKYLTALAIVTVSINFAISHEGMTILGYLPSGNPLTFESLTYSIAAAGIFASVICIFQCFEKVMTSDKLMHVLGKISPSLSLVFSMVLRFVPLMKKRAKTIDSALKCSVESGGTNSAIGKIKHGIKVIFALMNSSLENAIDTADSMKCRGYGLPKRSAFSAFEFQKRDAVLGTAVIIFSSYTLAGIFSGALKFSYFPIVELKALTLYEISVRASYAALCFTPVFIEILEKIKWKKLKSKI